MLTIISYYCAPAIVHSYYPYYVTCHYFAPDPYFSPVLVESFCPKACVLSENILQFLLGIGLWLNPVVAEAPKVRNGIRGYSALRICYQNAFWKQL
ncbi:hypothetical protein VNO78_11245 [Psophocarpus tetragonolobus]|uniref:Uncharacterized protein n=1 Tax=Psophocarpus tetragonolobus TaxID=3891 RepID=A0AAN9XN94_PSOTE